MSRENRWKLSGAISINLLYAISASFYSFKGAEEIEWKNVSVRMKAEGGRETEQLIVITHFSKPCIWVKHTHPEQSKNSRKYFLHCIPMSCFQENFTFVKSLAIYSFYQIYHSLIIHAYCAYHRTHTYIHEYFYMCYENHMFEYSNRLIKLIHVMYPVSKSSIYEINIIFENVYMLSLCSLHPLLPHSSLLQLLREFCS